MQKTIKDSANNYQGKTAKNISELKSISVDLVIQEEKGKDSNNEEFSYKYIEVDGEKYRFPDIVLKDLKQILEKKPSLKTFAVNKTGEGKLTRYIVIPLE